MEPTLKQAKKVLELIAQSGRSVEWIQNHFIGSGAFTDLLEVDDLMGMHRESHRRFLGLLPFTPACRWREQDGVIYLQVTSDGATGPEWVARLEKKGFRLSKWAKEVLISPDFKPTNGVTYEIAVFKGMLFEDSDRVTKKIRAEAERRNFTKPNAEVACLIRENFSDEEIEAMGLWWIVAMHEPINDSGGGPLLLSARRCGAGRWLRACYGRPDYRWSREGGFAFVASQVSA